MGEHFVVVVLADCEVYVVAVDHVRVQLAQDADVLPLLLVRILPAVFLLKALPERQQLYHVLCSLFEHNEPVNAPSIEAQTVIATHNKLLEELESHADDFVIVVECIERAFNNQRKVVWIEPLEEQVECL